MAKGSKKPAKKPPFGKGAKVGKPNDMLPPAMKGGKKKGY